ncbi:MAG: endonuclease/exonuclease/phosphatase family protein [Planctomycetota bacterium]
MQRFSAMAHCVVFLLLGAGLPGVPAAAQTGTFLDKLRPTDVRVVAYNLGGFNDGFSDQPFNFTGGQWRFDDTYARVIDALDADVWAFQEIAQRSSSDIRSAMNLADPLPNGESWQVYRSSNQVIASRYAFSDTGASVGGSPRRPTIATIDLPDTMSQRDLHLVNVHLKAGGGSDDETRRIDAIDRIQQYFREAQQPGDVDELEPATPTVFLGDFNTASGLDPVLNLLFGNITNEAVYGSDQALDWDGTSLGAIQPTHNNDPTGVNWTFRSSSGFTNRLDYQLFTDSTASLAQSFILNTQLMSSAERSASGLMPNDVLYNANTGFWDHLPVVADYSFRTLIIPEPASGVCLLAVVAGIGWHRRRTIPG